MWSVTRLSHHVPQRVWESLVQVCIAARLLQVILISTFSQRGRSNQPVKWKPAGSLSCGLALRVCFLSCCVTFLHLMGLNDKIITKLLHSVHQVKYTLVYHQLFFLFWRSKKGSDLAYRWHCNVPSTSKSRSALKIKLDEFLLQFDCLFVFNLFIDFLFCGAESFNPELIQSPDSVQTLDYTTERERERERDKIKKKNKKAVME